MKKIAIIFNFIGLILGVSPQALAQYSSSDDPYFQDDYSYEIGVSLGGMNCFTDLGGKQGVSRNFISDLNINNTRLAGSIYFSGSYRYFIAFRFEATFGAVKASDNVLPKNENAGPSRYQRNLSFRSSINDVMLVTEIHPLFFKRFDDGENVPKISPYLVGGVGLFSFRPEAKLNGKWVELKPLSTEGEGFSEYPDRKPYKLTQLNIPIGLGVKYRISPNFNLGMECVFRHLFTDYLDDVSTNYIDKEVFSKHFAGTTLTNALLLNDRKYEIDPSLSAAVGEQRGNPGKNDSYFTVNFKLGYVFQWYQ